MLEKIKTHAGTIVAVVISVALLYTMGCKATAPFRGEDRTAPEIEQEANKLITDLQARAREADSSLQSAVVDYEKETAAIIADEQLIEGEVELAFSEIERKEALKKQVFDFAANLGLVAASGGTVNTGEAIGTAIVLAGGLLGIGGTVDSVRQRRKRKQTEEVATNIVESIEEAKKSTLSIDSETSRLLSKKQTPEAKRFVDEVQRAKRIAEVA